MQQTMALLSSQSKQNRQQSELQDSRYIASPTRVKLSELSERLSNLQYQIDEDKQFKKETFETKIKVLGEGITKNVESDENKFRLLKEQLIKSQEGISTLKAARDILEERKVKEIKLVENNLQLELQKERQGKRDMDSKILKQIDEKIYSSKIDLARDRKIREDEEDREQQRIQDELIYAKEELEVEKKNREDNSEQLIGKLGDDILKLQEMLNFEKKVREENQTSMYKMLEEMDQQLNYQIQNEKKVRESSEEVLLRLLEETCNKMEINIHG